MKKHLLISACFITAILFVYGIYITQTPSVSDEKIESNAIFDYTNWEQQIFENIVNSEYAFQPRNETTFEAANRQNDARFFVSSNGFTTQNRKTGDDKIQITLASVHSGSVTYNSNAVPEIINEGQILSFVFDDYTLEYLNSPEGLRQNFLIHHPEQSSTDVKVKLHLDIAYSHTVENNTLFISKDGNVLIHYGKLKAYDAMGKELPSEMNLEDNTLELAVNTLDAIFPILIDPVSTTPNWSTEGNQVGANMGFAVSAAGDVNSDGYDDVVVGAAAFDAGETDEGKAFLFLGGPTGLSTTAIWEDEGDNTGGLMGKSVAAAGDVNGDGFDDLLIGLGLYSGGQSQEGRAHLYYGNSTGVSINPDWFYEADQAGAGLGFPLEGLGDVNGDGFDDIIIGANGFDAGEVDEGRAYVFYGSVSGLASTPDWQVESNNMNAAMGHAVGAAGDVNGDGYADAIVGGWNYSGAIANAGKAWVYLGGATGLSTTAVWEMEGDQANGYYAFWTSGVGDVNGDGYDDIMVGAKRYDITYADEGKAWLFHGGPGGPSTTAAWTGVGNNNGAEYAIQFGPAGDINNDGYGDVVMGSHFHTGTFNKEGIAYLYLGGASGLATTHAWEYLGGQSQANLGWTCDGAGDVNGDGYDDIIVGAFKYSNPQNSEGAAFVFYGINTCPVPSAFSVSGVTATTANATWTVSPAAINYKIVARRTGQTLNFISPTNSFTMTGLTPNKKYKAYVQAKCGTTWTLRSNIAIFITPPLRLGNFDESTEVFPNPADNWIQINPVNIEDNAIISIYNANGIEILSTFYNPDENSDRIYFDLSTFASGFYFYTIQTENKRQTGTFVKR